MSRIDCGKYKCLEEGTASCSNGQCVCKPGYIGDECVVKTCPGVTVDGIPCNSHGTCNNNKCRCDPNWYGLGCETYCDDRTTCSGHGVCGGDRWARNVPPEQLGKCVCNTPWYGEKCEQKPADPPSACKKMGNCGTGGGYIITNEYNEKEYINDPTFSGTDDIDLRTDPPTSTCSCNCKSGYYQNVVDPNDRYNYAKWGWGEYHPFKPSLKAPDYGLTSRGISTNTGKDGKCLPCPPGYYVDTVKTGEFSGKTICKKCGCPSVAADDGRTNQKFAKKADFSPLSASQVCSGGGTSATGDSELIQALGAECIPDELWCDNSKCHVKKSDAPCSLANRKCPTYYTDYGTHDDMCFPSWSVRHCLYEH